MIAQPWLNIGVGELLLLGLWPILTLIALFALRQRPLTGIAQAVWALLIIVVPVLGPLAFFIVQPMDHQAS